MLDFITSLLEFVFFLFWFSAAVGLLIPRVGDKFLELYHQVRFKGITKNEPQE